MGHTFVYCVCGGSVIHALVDVSGGLGGTERERVGCGEGGVGEVGDEVEEERCVLRCEHAHELHR